MTAKLLDGKEVSNWIIENLKKEVEKLKEKGITPSLKIFLVGNNPASIVYVGNKEKSSKSIGIDAEVLKYEEDVSEEKILNEIEKLNNDKSVNGIIVQLPLPSHINEDRISTAISHWKDVDGFHPYNLGMLLRGTPTLLPATPYGILELLRYYKIETEGKHVVVVGRSNIVGKPASVIFLLKDKFGNATVTVCHSKSKNLENYTRQADILIVAAGQHHLISKDMVKEGAVVIDVGIHRIDDPSKKSGYRLEGDVKFDEVKEVASYITPVPGGVGPMTVAMLLKNVVRATIIHNGIPD
jgi:methylenetetrahydrofolate dehydrogenase (NADP+)/methenyltetrahydrofolate cyclohydrolase